MEQIPREQMLKRYYLLPKSLQDVLHAEETADAMHKICTLRDAETHVPIVARLSGRVLLGYLRPEMFALEIQKETGIEMEKAQLIARDLDTEIFSAVRLELKKLYPPTIQTPTVQSWMGQKDLRPTTDDRRPSQQPTTYNLQPKYVIPIPEKFLRQNADVAQKSNVTRPDLQQPINQSTPIAGSKTNSANDNLKSVGGGRVSAQLPTQKATNSVVTGGIQRAEAEPQKSVGGGQVSGKIANQYGEVGLPTTGTLSNSTSSSQRQIAKEVTGSRVAEARPQERPDIQQQEPAKSKFNITKSDFQQLENKPALMTSSKTNSLGGDIKSVGGSPTSPQPNFKPIVPLPTFIQTQFKKQDPRSGNGANENPGSRLSNDSEMKNLIGKFSTSATQKPKPPAESPYREKI